MKLHSQQIERLWLWFFPRRCVWCMGVAEPTHMLCADCEPEAQPLLLAPDLVRDTQLPLISAFGYHSHAKRILLNVKYHGGRKNAHSIGYAMADALSSAGVMDKQWLLCSVPMTAAQVKTRGFNQSEVLAKSAARWLGLEYAPLLRKTRETQVQHDLPAAQREKNVDGAYCAAMPEQITGRKIVLVDDICTTGATMRACAKVLQTAGAEEIICLSFLRTDLEESP